MRNATWWLRVALLVALAAFLTGIIRGATGTAPFTVDDEAAGLHRDG